MKRVCIMLTILTFITLAENYTESALHGEWQYDSFTNTKNGGISGTLLINDSTITFDGEIHQDHPTSPQKSTISCTLRNGKCHYNYEKHYKFPIDRYYLILDSVIYFSWQPITTPEKGFNDHLGRVTANYSYSARLRK